MDALRAKHFLIDVGLWRDRVPSFAAYPSALPAIRGLGSGDDGQVLELHPHVTFFVGENGSGKSTLLEAIAAALGVNPEGGSRNFNFATRASHSELHRWLYLRKGIRRPKDVFFLRGESFYNVATEIERLDAAPAAAPSIAASYGDGRCTSSRTARRSWR